MSWGTPTDATSVNTNYVVTVSDGGSYTYQVTFNMKNSGFTENDVQNLVACVSQMDAVVNGGYYECHKYVVTQTTEDTKYVPGDLPPV